MNRKDEIIEMQNLLELEFHKVAIEAMKDNPFGDTPFAGYTLISLVTGSGDVYKEELKKNKSELGLTEAEIDEMINDVMKKVLKKYITNI